MNTLRRFLPCLPLLSVLGLLAPAARCATRDLVERVDPVTGEKSCSTTIWSSEKTGPTVTPEEVKKASQQPK